MAASTYENILGIVDRALRSRRNPEINRAGFLCSQAVRAEPYPMCTTQAEQSRDLRRRACIASAFRPLSEYFGGVCPYFLRWVQPSTFGSGPKLHQGLLRMRSHSAKQWR